MKTGAESVNLYVSGRLCMFGEHSDWAGALRGCGANIAPGLAIVTGIEEGIYASARGSNRFIARSRLDNGHPALDVPMDPQRLRETAREASFYSYTAGVASYMLENYPVGGIEVTIERQTLPIGRGLSSSAAICVLVARAFNQLYSLGMTARDEMDAAYYGELRTPSRCGRLDQACAFGIAPVLMAFDGNQIEVKPLFVKETLRLVYADMNGHKDTIRILRDLHACYPMAESERDRKVQWALGEENLRLTGLAARCLEQGASREFGALMDEAQALFDKAIAPACPEELTAPLLHRTLTDARVRALVYGGKGVGSQGDGSVQFVARDGDCQEKLRRLLLSMGMKAFALTLGPGGANGKTNEGAQDAALEDKRVSRPVIVP